ncbi:MAG: hypothetical protein FVQ80_11380 [Planctomycetes bacterium]|nr:hypothetical protein [Planctomycetota bacterium]
MNWLTGFLKSIDHNRGSVIGPLIAVLVIFFVTIGCTSTTPSLMSPGEVLSRDAFDREVIFVEGEMAAERSQIEAALVTYNLRLETLHKQIETGYASLNEKDLRAAKFIKVSGALATTVATGGITAPGVIAALLTLGSVGYGVGKGYDNRRKDGVITELKAGNGNAT